MRQRLSMKEFREWRHRCWVNRLGVDVIIIALKRKGDARLI